MTTLSDESIKDKLMTEFNTVLADAEALLDATTGHGTEKFAAIRAKAETSVRAVKTRMAEAQTAVLTNTKAAAKATDLYVHENPWRSIASAAGFGLLIGLLIGRR